MKLHRWLVARGAELSGMRNYERRDCAFMIMNREYACRANVHYSAVMIRVEPQLDHVTKGDHARHSTADQHVACGHEGLKRICKEHDTQTSHLPQLRRSIR